jgi:hypothetical protein
MELVILASTLMGLTLWRVRTLGVFRKEKLEDMVPSLHTFAFNALSLLIFEPFG